MLRNDLARKVLEVETELDMPHRHPTVFYSDSKDVLAWIKNDATNEAPKRYIVNRINTIRKNSDPDQWHYIPTKQNPADYVTRPISVEELRFAFHFCRTLLQQRNTLVLRLRSVFLGNQKHDARFQHQIKIIVL